MDCGVASPTSGGAGGGGGSLKEAIPGEVASVRSGDRRAEKDGESKFSSFSLMYELESLSEAADGLQRPGSWNKTDLGASRGEKFSDMSVS